MSKVNTNNLTKLERVYWMMIQSKGAVPMLKGRPGEAKTAILRTIAKKLNLQYIDIRLSQVDEVVVTGFPAVNEDGKTFSFRTPDWATKANSQPTLICFEEYNRARLEQRNAAMQIMCEREVGMNLKLNDDVYMVATGNLGEEDGTDVEEIEAAQKGRLATIRHNLTIQDWEDGYAAENVHPLVLSFVKSNPQYFYKYEGDEVDSYASARTWDYLSMFIKTNFGDKNVNYSELVDVLMTVGKSYVGSSITPLIRYITQMQQVSVKDILKKYDDVRDVVKGFNRPQVSEYLLNLSEMSPEKMKEGEVDNLIKFLKDINDDDELVNYFMKIVAMLDYASCEKNKDAFKNTSRVVNTFPDIKERMKKHMLK
jgi:hypothetical protein